MPYRIGIDIGGTFTDLVLVDHTGKIVTDKVPSTPHDPSIGVIDGINKLAGSRGPQELLADTELIVHGTTVCTNAVLQYRGVKAALLTTNGFRDTIEMRRGHREPPRYDLKMAPPAPVVPMNLRVGIEERLDYAGRVVTPLNEQGVRDAIRKFKAEEVQAVAVCLLFSFLNPQHERRIGEILRQEWPEVYVSLSSNVLAQVREYERASATVLNAYIGPILARYLSNLVSQLKSLGYQHELMIMQSNGGVATASVSSDKAVNTLLSGPAAGAAAAVYYATSTDIPNLISVDMGGTSFDVCLIDQGMPLTTSEGSIAGYQVSIPMVDIHSIGTGGGSIAWIDAGGVLQVGPQSAGASPGPACYGKGGTEPTVTDANVVLGYVNPNFFLGGQIKLDASLSERAIADKIGKPLGLSAVDAARSIFTVGNHHMADGIRVVSVQRGYDPRQFALVCGGGAGPIHAGRLAAELAIPTVIVPSVAGVFCAFGSIMSDLRQDYVRSYIAPLPGANLGKLNELFQEMEAEASDLLERQGVPVADRRLVRSMDMRYLGQIHEVEASVPSGKLTDESIAQVIENFHQRHETLYTYCERDNGTEIVNLRLTGIGEVPEPAISKQPLATEPSSVALKGKRKVYFEEFSGFHDTPIFDGAKLQHGHSVIGPAIIEAPHTTVVVVPNYELTVNAYGDYLMKVIA